MKELVRYCAALRRSWFWSRPSAVCLLLGVMPLIFMQVSVHEGTHCALLMVGPGSCDGIAPFPHAVGTLRIGGQTLSDVESADQMALWEAPQIVSALIIILLHGLARRVRDERLAVIVRLWILGACIDLLGNTIPTAGDWSMMAQRYDLDAYAVGVVSVPMWSVGLGGLLLPLGWRFETTRHLLHDFSPLPIACAAVSMVAIMVSLGVDVPEIDRGAEWFWVPVAR